MITLKDAERVVALTGLVRSLRADLRALDTSETGGRVICGGEIEIITSDARVAGWSGNGQQKFTISNKEARDLALKFISGHKHQRLDAAIRELHQLNAEIPS